MFDIHDDSANNRLVRLTFDSVSGTGTENFNYPEGIEEDRRHRVARMSRNLMKKSLSFNDARATEPRHLRQLHLSGRVDIKAKITMINETKVFDRYVGGVSVIIDYRHFRERYR